jgi:hypothetical protein
MTNMVHAKAGDSASAPEALPSSSGRIEPLSAEQQEALGQALNALHVTNTVYSLEQLKCAPACLSGPDLLDVQLHRHAVRAAFWQVICQWVGVLL